jgi:hypothetical protein
MDFIQETADKRMHKFSDPKYFIEFLIDSLKIKFEIEKDHLPRKVRNDIAKEKNQKSAEKYLEYNAKTCDPITGTEHAITIKEAMEIMGTQNRWEIDQPIGAGKIRKV